MTRKRATRKVGEPASDKPAIVRIVRVECDAMQSWESDLYCPVHKVYHTRPYKNTESEPAPNNFQTAAEMLTFNYSDTPEKFHDRKLSEWRRPLWHT